MTIPTRTPEAFTFIEEDPDLGNLPAPDAWGGLVARLEKLGDDDFLVRCGLGHSWQAKRVEVDGAPSVKPALCTSPACQLPMPVLMMTRKSIETIRKMAALPDGHRLARCAERHEWDADAEVDPRAGDDFQPPPPKDLRAPDGRPRCPVCDAAAEVCFVASPLVLVQRAEQERAEQERSTDGGNQT